MSQIKDFTFSLDAPAEVKAISTSPDRVITTFINGVMQNNVLECNDGKVVITSTNPEVCSVHGNVIKYHKFGECIIIAKWTSNQDPSFTKTASFKVRILK